jgi:biofilm protein TabA
MIVTDLEHAQQQVALTPALQKALTFLRQAGSSSLPDGRVEIDGEQVYALVQSYETHRGEPKFEAHRKYLDVQFVAAGEEIIGWALIDRMAVDAPYDEAKDVCLGRVAPTEVTPVRLSAGHMAVLYPTDAHAPKLAAGTSTSVKKIVVKVAV